MKCYTCERTIQNGYRLDGKIYGYECYKLALAQKYIHLQELKNDDWTKKCIAAIELFRNVEFLNSKWNKDFQTSVLQQWDDCNKLSGKQFEVIIKHIDIMEYNYIYFDLLEDEKKKQEQAIHITNWTKIKGLIDRYRHDNRLHNAIKIEHKTGIERRGRKYYIVEYRYYHAISNSFEILSGDQLEKLKEEAQEEPDELKIINIIEVE